MTSSSRTSSQFAAHAVCIAASVRDLLRTAQFYSRDMSNVDGGVRSDHVRPTLPSRVIAVAARFTDGLMTWAANVSIALFLPSWRRLPSPFEPGMVAAVAEAIRSDSLLHNPLFNAYFFRAAKHITAHYADPPNLVLEHRVDASRRLLATDATGEGSVDAAFMARLLLALVDAKPVARIGRLKQPQGLLRNIDPNVPVFAISVLALLFAENGKPLAISDESEFFFVIGALIQPRLAALAEAVEAGISRAVGSVQSWPENGWLRRCNVEGTPSDSLIRAADNIYGPGTQVAEESVAAARMPSAARRGLSCSHPSGASASGRRPGRSRCTRRTASCRSRSQSSCGR